MNALKRTAGDFYRRHGFIAIADRPLTLYLPLETGLRALGR